MGSCCAPGRHEDTIPRQVRTGDPGAGSTVPISLADIPPGTFTMGTNDPAGYPGDGEGPAHAVTLRAFRMSVHTVTNDLFAAFVHDSGHRTTAEELGTSFVFGGLLPDDFPPTRGVAATPWW